MVAGRSRSAGAGPARDEAAHTAHGWSLCGSGGLRSGLQRHWQSVHDGHGGGGSGLARGLQDNLRRAAPCSAPGRPKRSTGAPPGSGPTRPGPASASAAPPARASPLPARVGGAARGRGPRGVPAPGRGHAQAPHVTRVCWGARRGLRGGERDPSRRVSVTACRTARSAVDSAGGSPPTGAGAPGPAAAGHCSSTKGQGAARRPLPLAALIEARPRHSPASESGAGTEGQLPAAPRLPGPCAPALVGGRGRVPCLAHPTARWRRYTRICGGGAPWRSVLRAHLLAPRPRGSSPTPQPVPAAASPGLPLARLWTPLLSLGVAG